MSKQYFTDEFKIEAVKQITELGYSTSEVASRLGVSAHSLYAWKKRFGKPEIQRTLEDAQEAELKRLRQKLKRVTVYWSSCAGHFYLRIFILQWAHPIVGCMRPFKIVIMNELRDFLFNSVFIHSRSVT